MNGHRSAVWCRALQLVALAAVVNAAQAQSTLYRCPGPQGDSIWTDRPCHAQGRAALTAYGPVPESARRSAPGSYAPPLRRAPEHQAYLSPQCAQLNDALRTGPSRGLKSPAMNDLHDTYRRDCAEDEQAAHQRLSRDRMAQREARKAEQMAAQAMRDEARSHREQCDEMQRILQGKRQRLDRMHEGEKADLQRFQSNYTQRCRAG